MANKTDRIRELAREREKRKREGLALYRPMPTQEAFHRSIARFRIVRGGTRSGKSTSVAAEFARAVTGQDPFGKYPTNRPLLAYIVGYDGDHIGRAIFRLLFKSGLFDTIKDGDVWRTFDPVADAGREKEIRPSQPLIPGRFIDPKGWAWENKQERIFSVCRLNFGEGHPMNGTEIRAFGSRAKPAQGDPVDIIWIDEDLFDDEWIDEMKSRVSDKNQGRLMWSAFPKGSNDALYNMSTLGEEKRAEGEFNIEEFILAYSDNIHIPTEVKKQTASLWTEEERKARDFGEFQLESVQMYPEFHITTHGVPQSRNMSKLDQMVEAYMRLDGKLPDDWCRYAYIDPGHSVCAVLGVVIPPLSIADVIIAEWELYLRQCNAEMFARHFAAKINSRCYQSFIIDEHGSRVTQAGSGVNIKIQYSQALVPHGVSSVETGNWFMSGSDDVHGRCMKARELLMVRKDGTTKFRCLGNLHNLRTEFGRYRKKPGTDMPVQKNNHLMDCFGYMAAHNPQFQKFEVSPILRNPVLQELQRWNDQEARKNGGANTVNLGPPQTAAA